MVIYEIYKEEAWLMCIILENYNSQAGTGKCIYNPLILDNKQPLPSMIDHKATQVCQKIFPLNYSYYNYNLIKVFV